LSVHEHPADFEQGLTHRDGKRANGDLDTGDRNKKRLNTACRNEPIETLKREPEREQVFEHEQAREALNRHIACHVNQHRYY
jgi:hypothetical protein